MMDTANMLSVVMPAYNEEINIYNNLIETSKVLSGFSKKYEIIAVNDGSKDQTKTEIQKAAAEDAHIHLVSYRHNKGKGNAIKQGVLRAKGEYIAFLDSDLDIPPAQLEAYIKPLMTGEAEVVIGSKMHKDSRLEYPTIRKVISFGYFCMLKLLFHLNVKDTQTGLKVFKADALKSVISLIKTRGFAYDIEILVALNSRKYRIMEMPVEIVFHRGEGMGRIRIKDIIKVFKDTLTIFYRANIKKYYQL